MSRYRTAAEWRELSLQSLGWRRSNEQGLTEWEHACQVLIEAYDAVEASGEIEWDRKLAVCAEVAGHVVHCAECHERHESGWTPAERLLTRVEVAPFAAPILAELVGWQHPKGAIRQLIRRAREANGGGR